VPANTQKRIGAAVKRQASCGKPSKNRQALGSAAVADEIPHTLDHLRRRPRLIQASR